MSIRAASVQYALAFGQYQFWTGVEVVEKQKGVASEHTVQRLKEAEHRVEEAFEQFHNTLKERGE